ncbi:TEA domain-containing protein [Favolaschia claudopus]|uniref:TEA domain-containing protein n=1 Tax=Favolaschia claudopus TaxID=2862362 RepID=A0AAW0DY50_9AGAR
MYYDLAHMEEIASSSSSLPPIAGPDHLYTPITGDGWPSLHHSQSTNDVLQSVLKVRKSWKTLRGGETVWPPELEAALIEGLENYQPDDSRETRMLGRFPRRNRFISDYIFEKTGRKRSAKQVGSRLQQLRESCGGKKRTPFSSTILLQSRLTTVLTVLHLLSPFRQPAYSDSSASSDGSCTSPVSPVTPGQSFSSAGPPCTPHTVYIDILPKAQAASSNDEEVAPNPMWLEGRDGIHVSGRPRCLDAINPTVTFMSRSSVIAESRFTVYSVDDRIVHEETTSLSPVPDVAVEGCLYSTSLVPQYWKVISDSQDPTQFTIYQEVVKTDNSTIVFSATYRFSYRSRDSSGFPSPADTPSTPHTRSDIDSLLSAASLEQASAQPPGDRYPLYIAPEWSPNLPSSRENSPQQGYHSPTSDCFPAALSNYVL